MVEAAELSVLDIHDDGVDKPSQEVNSHGFIYAMNRAQGSTPRSGKWCVVRDASTIDAIWAQVRQAVLAGEIAGALVSTPHQAAQHGNTYVICVFNNDWNDKARVDEIREMLRGFGVTEEIGYKRDIDTIRGVYGTPAEWTYRA